MLALQKIDADKIRLVTLGAPASYRYFVPALLRWADYPKFDISECANNIDSHWNLLHEVRDNIVPFGHGQLLHSKTLEKDNVQFIPLVGGDHKLDIKKIERYLF